MCRIQVLTVACVVCIIILSVRIVARVVCFIICTVCIIVCVACIDVYHCVCPAPPDL